MPGNIQGTHSQDLHGQRFHLTWSQSGRVQAPRGSAFSSTGKVQGVRGNRQIYKALEIARETSALRKLKAPSNSQSHVCVAGDLCSWIFALHVHKDRLPIITEVRAVRPYHYTQQQRSLRHESTVISKSLSNFLTDIKTSLIYMNW